MECMNFAVNILFPAAAEEFLTESPLAVILQELQSMCYTELWSTR
jgi:hypothetical protein